MGGGLGVRSQLGDMIQHNTIQYDVSGGQAPAIGNQRSHVSQPHLNYQHYPESEISRNGMVTTNYSSSEVAEPNGSLQLLKMRLSSRDQQQLHATLDTNSSSQR